MAIRPRFAQAILDGRKHVEFRKRRLAADVDTVLVYESSPTQRIVGQFTVARTVKTTPEQLWAWHGSVGAISREDFMRYYTGHTTAYGLVVSRTQRFEHPVALAEISPAPAVPQSFCYLPSSVSTQLTAMQPMPAPFSLRAMVGDLNRRPVRALVDAAP